MLNAAPVVAGEWGSDTLHDTGTRSGCLYCVVLFISMALFFCKLLETTAVTIELNESRLSFSLMASF